MMARKATSNTKNNWRNRYSGRQLMAAFIIVAFAAAGVITTTFSRAATSATGVVTGIGGMCLDNLDAKAMNANTVSLWHCDGTAAQQWTVPGDGTIRNQGYCLDVQYGGKRSQTPVWLWKCNGTGAQQWKVKGQTLVNPQSGLCLDDKYAKTTDGNPIWVYTCNGTAAQTWKVPSTSAQPTPPTPTPTPPAPTPAPNGPTVSGEEAPGAVSGWKQTFVENFGGTVPKGAFNTCEKNADTIYARCAGLNKTYAHYYDNWWAYPSGWPDTAKSGADGNTGAPFGGTYEPQDTIWVGNGVMTVRMYRPDKGGDNRVGTAVPIKCMNQKYGRYAERFKVTVKKDSKGKPLPGFKSAHLFYQGGYEIDFPENDYVGGTISAYMHPGGANFSTKAQWIDTWHTSVIEWTAGSVKFYLDGKLVGTTTNKVPQLEMSWILQNESSIMGPYAAPGTWAQIDTDWVTCYAKG